MSSEVENSIAIRIVNLRRKFDSQQVLDGIDLDCPRGQVTTIVGPSGCGKTVLLKHLMLLLRPDSGQIIIDGIDITRVSGRGLNDVREKFGVLFQGGALFDSMSVEQNVAFPLVEKTARSRDQIAAEVAEKLAAVELEGMGHKFPSEISGGMQKRAALARALIRNPKILYLDEPTTGLDPSRTGSIHKLIQDTHKRFGLTVVMVSHDVPQVFEVSDRVAFIDRGKVHLSGTVEQVMGAHDEIFERFLAGKASGQDEELSAVRETRP